MTAMDYTLEEIFLQLTTEDAAGEASSSELRGDADAPGAGAAGAAPGDAAGVAVGAADSGTGEGDG